MGYKLVYFYVRGLGEQIRMLLEDNKIEYEEDTIQLDNRSKFVEMKPKLPFGQLPVLYDGSVEIAQTGAIMRHLARKHNLYGDTPAEAAFLDMFYDGCKDVHNRYVRLIYVEYDAQKGEFTKNYLPGELEKLDTLLGRNGGPWILGNKKSFVDYFLFDIVDIMQILDPNCLTLADGKKLTNLANFWKDMQEKRNLKEFFNGDTRKNRQINGNKNK